MIKFVDILSRYEAAEFSQLEAAELLGIGERTFRRWRQRYEEEGETGLVDRRLGKASGKRERRPLPGMMLHQDGSRHVWLEGQPALDLIVTLDDATSEIYSAFLVEEEGTASTFRALAEVFGGHGLPLSLYTDRGSHYFHTPEAGGKVDRARLTQVGRALAHLGVEHIAAYSPQARGRSERVFQTLQDRLVKELALAGIVTVEAANRFLREVYLPAHNARFAVAPAHKGSAFVAIPGARLFEVVCVACDKRQAVMQRRGGDDEIRLRKGVTRLAAQSGRSERRAASSTHSIPNRISANVTALT